MKAMQAASARSDLSYDVRRYGSFLSTRASGEKLRHELETEIRAGSPATVKVDFTDVEAVTISFADEFIGRLMAARAAGDLGDATISIVGINGEVEEALSICLERRNALALAERADGARLLGGEQHEIETLEVAFSESPANATTLAAALGITAQSVNNRLKRLADYGVLRRSREAPLTGGREYVYSAPAGAHSVAVQRDPNRPTRSGKTTASASRRTTKR